MKARGLYVCCTLSYKGVEFEVVEAPLEAKMMGLELEDFISGPKELLLKFVEENYPLREKPEALPGEESVKELQRKRHLATPGVSFKGRVRKVAKWRAASDAESED
ncbi:hypothetical protein RHSIM_RhsimUnG0048600 [Rhododendron simsii]|uniref:Uncharacterized protein n=1 Tax=Rhododendron simsii TaxID=118357 RepID=A0A834G2I4_RHOSS|nr:hypothetical protein RHSIM_RhsimUnG0048600 [Rhododendron simsii]